MRYAKAAVLLTGLLLIASACDAQNCGWSSVDHRVGYDASGAWNPSVYRGVVGALTLAEAGGAVWESSETRFGKTMWQGVDSEIVAAAAATAGKYAFTRVRPSTTDNSCLWFQGGSNFSFSSGEASMAAALVTPYVLEYGSEYPATYASFLLPLYVGAGRIKNQAHWQTDAPEEAQPSPAPCRRRPEPPLRLGLQTCRPRSQPSAFAARLAVSGKIRVPSQRGPIAMNSICPEAGLPFLSVTLKSTWRVGSVISMGFWSMTFTKQYVN